MLHVVFYFQVHQPYRLRHVNVMDVGSGRSLFDENLNRSVMHKVTQKCYLPTNALLLDLIKRHEGRFKIAYSITGTAYEQFAFYAPEVIESFEKLVETGCVELLGETYFHSLSALYDTNEFLDQVMMHKQLMKDKFGYDTVTFRNTE
ncbi:MAG: alpha-amylase, partial [Candidatus Cloacimonetes bacterium]|nr:alpha-amylase [Candidatus Cloacimonadota bacterium]